VSPLRQSLVPEIQKASQVEPELCRLSHPQVSMMEKVNSRRDAAAELSCSLNAA
jgi:hypothetical protein